MHIFINLVSFWWIIDPGLINAQAGNVLGEKKDINQDHSGSNPVITCLQVHKIIKVGKNRLKGKIEDCKRFVIKGQTISEVIVSLKIWTKNCQEFCPV